MLSFLSQAQLDQAPDLLFGQHDIVGEKSLIELFDRYSTLGQDVELERLSIDLLPGVAQFKGQVGIEVLSTFVLHISVAKRCNRFSLAQSGYDTWIAVLSRSMAHLVRFS